MLYTASLNLPTKRAFKEARQSNINKICELLPLDPESSDMDVVVLGPKDLTGPRANMVQTAINSKHPDTCVIYIFEKQEDGDLLEGVYKFKSRKIKAETIKEAVSKYVGEHKIRAGKQQTTSADFQALSEPEPEQKPKPAPVEDEEEFIKPVKVELKKDNLPPLPVEEEPPIVLPETPLESTQQPFTPPPIAEPVAHVEDSLAKLHNFEDWEIFKEHLRKDTITKKLIEENSEYAGLVQMLEVLDTRIQTVWRDQSLSSDKKFEKIKSIGLEKSVVRASANSIQIEKVLSIISTIVLSAKRTVDDKVESINVAMYKLNTDKAAIADTSYIDRAIEERTKVQIELLNIGRSIVDLYKAVDHLVDESIRDLDSNLPSSNQFINGVVAPIGMKIFKPQNTAILANKLGKALQENRIVWSEMEEVVSTLIDQLFALCAKDEEIIRYQQHALTLLKSNRVEDPIVAHSLLKKLLRVYTGVDNTGRSATAITWGGILSRRSNTLLIDLTGKAKFREYGITPVSLNEFMNNRIEHQFVCVEAKAPLDPVQLQQLIEELKARLSYFQYVNVIMDPCDIEGIKIVCEDAISVNYITNCSTSSINQLREVIAQTNVQNVAKKLIMIDTPTSPLTIADNLGVDATCTKLITLPAMPAIKACALRHDRPYEYDDIVGIFEEAFR